MGCQGQNARSALILAGIAMYAAAVLAEAEQRWVRGAVIQLCPQPLFPQFSGCRILATGMSFEIFERQTPSIGAPVYRAREGSLEGFVTEADVDALTTTEDPRPAAAREKAASEELLGRFRQEAAKERAECVRRGEPQIGMTTGEAVETCWRRPNHIVKRTTAAGVEEDYLYGAARALRFRDGKHAEIIETR